jgi:hypothetical protein
MKEETMKCPHCRTAFHDEAERTTIGEDADGGWVLVKRQCPECNRIILHLENGTPFYGPGRSFVLAPDEEIKSIMVRPKGSSRPPCPTEVPKEFAEDYNDACVVLPDSPKASAALSRRCLQNILREVAKVKPSNLADEIQEVIDSGTLPSYIVEAIDAVRNVGKFATHQIKSEKTGEILSVELGEAEWNLDVLEALFDFYFVQPNVIKKKRTALDQKLKEAGKKPMK